MNGVKLMSRKPIVIRFFAPGIKETVQALLNMNEDKMRQGASQFILLISSPGGDAFRGLRAYNPRKKRKTGRD